MTVVLPPPPSVRAAVGWLIVAAVLQLLSGAVTTLFLASIAYADPALAGDLSLPIAVTGVGGTLTLIGTLLPLGTAASLREGRPAGRILLAIIGAGLCLSPLLPLGAWMVYVAVADEQVSAWYRALGVS